MSNNTLEEAVKNTAVVAALLTAAPVLGAVGTLSAVGFAVSAAVGSAQALIDKEEDAS